MFHAMQLLYKLELGAVQKLWVEEPAVSDTSYFMHSKDLARLPYSL